VGLTFQTGAESDTTFDTSIGSSTARDIGVQKDVDPTSAEGQGVRSGDFDSSQAPSAGDATASTQTVNGDTQLADGVEGGTFEVTVSDDGTAGDSGVTVDVEGSNGQEELGQSLDLSTGSNTFNLEGTDIQLTAGDLGFSDDSPVQDGPKTFEIRVEDTTDIGDRVAFEGGDEARNVIDDVQSAIGQVSGELSDLGAAQNRLSFKESNLETTKTNLSAAQSRIEDADFAKEQTQVAKLQVQQQSGTAQLAQANAAGQSVLSLLQG
jgi:flagellin